MPDNFKVDFIGIGAPRSGTTWVYEALKAHPEICVSKPKELNFFNDVQMFWRKDLIGKSNYSKGLEWYKKHFRHCGKGKVVGEITPDYLFDPKAAERIYKHFPNIKLFAILRESAERLYSHYIFTREKGFYKLPETFEEVIEKEKGFVEMGLYYKHLQNYLKYFSREQMLVLIYDDIKKDPRALLRELYAFVGVDNTFVPSTIAKNVMGAGQVSERKKLLALKKTIEKIPLGRPFLRAARGTKPYQRKREEMYERAMTDKRKAYEPMNEETRKKLKKIFREDIEKLERLIGRDLRSWK